MSGVPGRGGPVPKRQAQRRRANKPEVEVRSAPAAPAGKAQPPAAARDWHPIARRWYKALAESGQSVYYEPSDWATAYLLAEVISRELQPQIVGRDEETGKPLTATMPVKGASLAAWLKAMTGLMVTEGERRRARVELTRTDEEPAEEGALSKLDEYRRRALSG
ncbi:phage terminase small subunit [Parafrankia discariae]|uniref:phage terminase small subunit n=1 Tax=Parafrankia discariae TaxID=365528 RepID=UPI0003A05D4C|nr:hypothetical protein [Parafrankia discariae]